MQNISHFYLSIIFLFFSHLLLGQTAEKEILWTADWSPNGKLVAIGGNRIVTTDFKQGIVLWNEKAKVIKVF